MRVIARCHRLDRALERLNWCDDAAEGQEADQRGKPERGEIDGQDLRPRAVNRRDRRCGGSGPQIIVVLNPLAGQVGQGDAGRSGRGPELRDGIVTPSLFGERHYLTALHQVLAVQGLKPIEKLPLALVAQERRAVLLKRLGQRAIVLIEGGACRGALALVSRQDAVAHRHPELGEAPDNAAERRHASELVFGNEPAALLDLRQAQPGEDAERQQRHQGNRHEND